MSDLTSTNEELLIETIQRLKPNEEVYLQASSGPIPMIEIYILPTDWSSHKFEREYKDLNFWHNPYFAKKYWKGSMLGVALHKDVWLKFGDASKYR